MVMQFQLTMRSGPEVGKEFHFEKEEIFLGRDLSNDIVINDTEISRKHAKIYLSGRDFIIEDLNSTNGTVVRGRKISKGFKLGSGDLINLSENTILEYQRKTAEVTRKPKKKVEKISEEPISEEVSDIKKIDEQIAENDAQGKKMPSWVVILLVALIFLVIFCLVPLIIIEFTNQWCNLFSGFFNAISPGVCP